jgi:hypothetical protein
LTALKEPDPERFTLFELNPPKWLLRWGLFSIFMLESQNKGFVNTVWREPLLEQQNERGLSTLRRNDGDPAQAIVRHK